MSPPSQAVFLSYASQDADAVRRICDALRAVGLDVWFDQIELRGGDAWDASIRRQIKDCALFMPIISANTQAREEGYFRLEWKLAVDRSHLIVDDKAFLLPVVIDETSDAGARVPDKFRDVQWMRLPAGVVSRAFVERVQHLIEGGAGPSDPGRVPGARPSRASRFARWRWSTVGILAFGLAGLVSWGLLSFFKPSSVPPPSAMSSVAVLPFKALGGSPTDERFAEVLTIDVTTILSQDNWMRVTGQGLVAAYKSELNDPLLLGRDLHVRFLAVGEVHDESGKIIVSMHLIDTETGSTAWSERFEFEARAVEDGLVRLANRPAQHVSHAIYEAEKRRATANPNSSDAWNVYMRTADFWDRGGDLSIARKQMESILQLNPNFVPALAAASNAIINQLMNDTDGDSARTRRDMEELDRYSSRAVVLGPDDSFAWRIRAHALTWLGRWDEALAANARGQALNAGSAGSLMDRALILIYMGNGNGALSLIQQARAIDSDTVVINSEYVCLGQLILGLYREATPACEQSGASGQDWHDQVLLIAVYAQQGEMAKADAAKTAALNLKPGLTITRLKSMPSPGSEAYLDALETYVYPGLRRAGVPE